MRLTVGTESQTRLVELDSTADGKVRAVVDGTPIELEVRTVDGGLFLVAGERSLEIVGAVQGTRVIVWSAADGERSVEVLDERQAAARAAGSRAAKGQDSLLKAPMPGRVVKVLVAPGERVERGQGCIVVEAMKMENELGAPSSGTVKSVAAEVGKTVDAGQVLLELAV